MENNNRDRLEKELDRLLVKLDKARLERKMIEKFEVEYRRFVSWNSMGYTDQKATFYNSKSMLHFYDNMDWGDGTLSFQCIRHNGKLIKYSQCARYSHQESTDIDELAKYRN